MYKKSSQNLSRNYQKFMKYFQEEAAIPDELYMAGMAVSMLSMGGVSDMYGRKTTLLFCQEYFYKK